MHQVRALVQRLGDHIARVVDHIAVVTQAAGHGVGPQQAVDHVVGAVAGDPVIGTVAGAVDQRRAGEAQVFQVGAQRVAHRTLNQIGALAERLGHHIARIVHHVGVVAQTADQGVRAARAIEHVGCSVAGDGVATSVASAIDRRRAGESESLDIARQHIGDRALHQIVTLAGEFDHRIACAADYIGVVAAQSTQHVGAAVAGEDVGQRVARAIDRREAR